MSEFETWNLPMLGLGLLMVIGCLAGLKNHRVGQSLFDDAVYVLVLITGVALSAYSVGITDSSAALKSWDAFVRGLWES